MRPLVLLTRGSPLARRQAELAAAHLGAALGRPAEIRILVTTGDRQADWSLEKQGGKGLFTAELEQALLRGEGDLAIHSAKDLPTELPAGLGLAGFLPREDARDALVRREGVAEPRLIATGSPRRRAQGRLLFPRADWTELRGNVDTRLRKVAAGQADASFLACAGMNRLGIRSWEGLVIEPIGLDRMVPAAGQGAVALQCRLGDLPSLAACLDAETGRAVDIERLFLSRLGEGCHTAFACHVSGGEVHLFREDFGRLTYPMPARDAKAAEPLVAAYIAALA
ncbi:MAG: hydroxymethylbilane synthase [Opitutia bacterium]